MDSFLLIYSRIKIILVNMKQKMIKLELLCKDIEIRKVDLNFRSIPLYQEKLEQQFERQCIIKAHNVFMKEKAKIYKEKEIELKCDRLSHNIKSKSLNKKSHSSLNILTINTFPKLLKNKSFSNNSVLKPRTKTVTCYSEKNQSKLRHLKMPPLPFNHAINNI